jgi:aminoglycoside phosphotransferase (APT) family kinase protein
VSAVPLQGGVNATVFELVLADGSSLVLKLYSEPLASELEKEAAVYELIAARGLALPVPRVLYTEARPQPFALMTKLPGRLLEQLQPGLSDEELTPIYAELGSMLRELHSIRLEAFGYVGAAGVVDPQPTNEAYMRSRFALRLSQFGELGGGEGLRRAIERHVVERTELFAGCDEACLCHNDLHEANVLVTDGRITGIVDVGNATAADPLLDLAKTFTYSRRPSPKRIHALAAGHGDLRADWRDALDLYVLFHRLELWWWFAATGARADALPRLAAEMASTVGV